jgi:hypothetical protein
MGGVGRPAGPFAPLAIQQGVVLQRITPCRRFNFNADEAVGRCPGICGSERVVRSLHDGDEHPELKGQVPMIDFQMEGRQFQALSGRPPRPLWLAEGPLRPVLAGCPMRVGRVDDLSRCGQRLAFHARQEHVDQDRHCGRREGLSIGPRLSPLPAQAPHEGERPATGRASRPTAARPLIARLTVDADRVARAARRPDGAGA